MTSQRFYPDNTHIPAIKNALDKIAKLDPDKISPAGKKLREFLIEKKMTVNVAAMRCGFSPGPLYEYVSGYPGSYPTIAQAFALEWLTEGRIEAWEWLDNPYIQRRVRNSQAVGAKEFERRIKLFILKFKSLTRAEGMIRHKARMLSRLFGVEWGEVTRRVWEDAKEKAKAERYDLTDLMREPNEYDDITDDEHREANESEAQSG